MYCDVRECRCIQWLAQVDDAWLVGLYHLHVDEVQACYAVALLHIAEVCQFELVNYENGIATFRASILPERTGMYQVGTRIYPKHADLPHRQDFPIVKWL